MRHKLDFFVKNKFPSMITNNSVLNEAKLKLRETITIEVNNSQKKIIIK